MAVGRGRKEPEIQRDVLRSAAACLDQIKLRGALAQFDNRAGDPLIAMLVESGLLEDTGSAKQRPRSRKRPLPSPCAHSSPPRASMNKISRWDSGKPRYHRILERLA